MKHEYKKVYDPTMGKYIRKHIYGEGFSDIFGRIFSGLTGEVAQNVAQKAAQKAAEASAQTLGEKAGTALGERLFNKPNKPNKPKKLMVPETSDYEVNERVSRLLSGSGFKRQGYKK